ncbi:MAG: restriction endonuclease [Candidatus Atribacteria bacterium]|nr:restriction endonuclease [Candidatus Atribacteria bacterium]
MKTIIYNKNVLEKYHSKSQIARILSENWFEKEMYCPNCLHEELIKNPNNTKVTDFVCDYCNNEFQLKAQSKPFYSKVVDGAFYPMINSIQQNATPNFSFMEYSFENWKVQNLFFIPKFFFTPSIIEKRKPLSTNARRSGWIGCNVLLSKIPELGKIKVIENEMHFPEKEVQRNWKRLSFMDKEHAGKRAWLSDILYCIQQLNKKEFTLDEMYNWEDYLSKLHPKNYNIKPKIRQQLQMLRDGGILEFKSRGAYIIKK